VNCQHFASIKGADWATIGISITLPVVETNAIQGSTHLSVHTCAYTSLIGDAFNQHLLLFQALKHLAAYQSTSMSTSRLSLQFLAFEMLPHTRAMTAKQETIVQRCT
jgi:hypothetical protein